MAMMNATRTRQTGRRHLTQTCIVHDSPYPMGADGEVVAPMYEIHMSCPNHVYPYDDRFRPPPMKSERHRDEIDLLMDRMPDTNSLDVLSRLEHFMQYDALELGHSLVREFHRSYPTATRQQPPQNVTDVLFFFHADIVKSILSATVFPLGESRAKSLNILAGQLLRDPLCRLEERNLSMLEILVRTAARCFWQRWSEQELDPTCLPLYLNSIQPLMLSQRMYYLPMSWNGTMKYSPLQMMYSPPEMH